MIAISARAVACDCLAPQTLPAKAIANDLREYPILLLASIKSTERPWVCRVTALRWLYRFFHYRDISVTHELAVKKILAGRVNGPVRVIEPQGIAFDGCQPYGEPACQKNFLKTKDLWILKRSSGGAYERARLCTTYVVLYGLTNR